jgi:hypothetical protein
VAHVTRDNDFDTVLACQDSCIRIIHGSNLFLEIPTDSAVTALAFMEIEADSSSMKVPTALVMASPREHSAWRKCSPTANTRTSRTASSAVPSPPSACTTSIRTRPWRSSWAPMTAALKHCPGVGRSGGSCCAMPPVELGALTSTGHGCCFIQSQIRIPWCPNLVCNSANEFDGTLFRYPVPASVYLFFHSQSPAFVSPPFFLPPLSTQAR